MNLDDVGLYKYLGGKDLASNPSGMTKCIYLLNLAHSFPSFTFFHLFNNYNLASFHNIIIRGNGYKLSQVTLPVSTDSLRPETYLNRSKICLFVGIKRGKIVFK